MGWLTANNKKKKKLFRVVWGAELVIIVSGYYNTWVTIICIWGAKTILLN